MGAEISDEFLAAMRTHLAQRQIGAGLAALRGRRSVLSGVAPGRRNAAEFAGCLAEWVDIGHGDVALIRKLLACFPPDSRRDLSLRDYLEIRMAEGFAAMAEEDSDEAIRHFDAVLSLGEEMAGRVSLAITHFWKARCLRKKGEYDSALEHTIRGRDAALALGYPRVAAVMRVLESWLCFQKGKPKEAATILRQAEAVLRDTDDYVTLGNIQSAYGRMARREGRSEQAIAHFAGAIEQYRKHDPEHQHLARTLSNLAYAKRSIALELARRIDAGAARRRKSAKTAVSRNGRGIALRQRLHQLRREALAELDQADQIYKRHLNHRGAGSVHLNRGLLFHDSGEFDAAEREAGRAFSLGEEKHDYILMARARLLACMIENARLEEQVEEQDDPRRRAQAANEFARQALEFAQHTQNSRLLARAWIWLGLTLTNDLSDDPERARQCADQASALIRAGSNADLMDDLQELKSRILRAGGVDSALRSWSQGLTGERTFQQMTEEFAELVIPKVWMREGKKVSRVAERLSISPKKVRRILRRAGLQSGARC